MLGLPASTAAEGVESFAQACSELAKKVGIQMAFKDQKINEKEWMDSRREIALLAFEDQCSPANPRLPMVEDMEEILTKAYFGDK